MFKLKKVIDSIFLKIDSVNDYVWFSANMLIVLVIIGTFFKIFG